MMLAVGMAMTLYLLIIAVHCSIVRRLGLINSRKMRTFLLICIVLGFLHIGEVGLYAVAFSIGDTLGIGSFDNVTSMSAMDTFYFSLVNFTTLGLGQVYPTGHLRFLAGFEAFNGFLCISMSASLIFRWVHGDN